MNYEILLAFVGASMVLGLSPGPDNIFVLTQSLAHGTKYGLATVFGLITGCLVHTTLLAFGASAMIEQHATLFFVIKLFGAAYLLYLAFKVFREDGSISVYAEKTGKLGLWALFRRGFFMNVLNPKVTLFFLAFFPGFLFSKTMDTIWQFYILGFLFMAVTLVVFGGIAVLSGGISSYLNKNQNTGSILKWMQIVVFIGIATYLLVG